MPRDMPMLSDSRGRQERAIDGLLRFLGVAKQTGNPDAPIKVGELSAVTELFDRDVARQDRAYEKFKRRIPKVIRD
jgi:hypothetical protein